MLSPTEWKQAMAACRKLSRNHKAGVAMRDPLYVPMSESSPEDTPAIGGCSIGYGGLAVDSDGTAYPCRRLPIAIGNLLTDSFETIWNHPLMEQLRDRDQLKGQCGGCRWRWRCAGCRAIAHGISGDPLTQDPQCPYGRLARLGVQQLVTRALPRPSLLLAPLSPTRDH
jgi:radical SAM protein with 4Fe4S-binding SPASM domain